MAQIYITTMTDVIMDTCYQRAGLEPVLWAAKQIQWKVKQFQTNNLTKSKAALCWLNNHMGI